MVPFDLDTRVEEVEEAVCPQIASKFLCTPGRPTGGIARFTTQCTNVCSISVGFKQLVALSHQSGRGGNEATAFHQRPVCFEVWADPRKI